MSLFRSCQAAAGLRGHCSTLCKKKKTASSVLLCSEHTGTGDRLLLPNPPNFTAFTRMDLVADLAASLETLRQPATENGNQTSEGEVEVGTYFICFTIVLFPDSPAPGKQQEDGLVTRPVWKAKAKNWPSHCKCDKRQNGMGTLASSPAGRPLQ